MAKQETKPANLGNKPETVLSANVTGSPVRGNHSEGLRAFLSQDIDFYSPSIPSFLPLLPSTFLFFPLFSFLHVLLDREEN